MKAKREIKHLEEMMGDEAKLPAGESFFPVPEEDPTLKSHFLYKLNEVLRENFQRYFVSKAEYAVSEFITQDGETQSGIRVVARVSTWRHCSPDPADGIFRSTCEKEVWLERGGSVPEFISKIESARDTMLESQAALQWAEYHPDRMGG